MRAKLIAKSTIMFTLLTAACLLSSYSALAGTQDGGGGVGFLCNESGSEKLYLADTYKLRKQGTVSPSGISDFWDLVKTLDQKSDHTILPLNPFDPNRPATLGDALLKAERGLVFLDVKKELPFLNDDYITEVPQGCRKIQVAIQELKTGRVEYIASPQLDAQDMLYLRLHEAFISLRSRAGLSTAPIRSRVELLAQLVADPSKVSAVQVKALVKETSDDLAMIAAGRPATLYVFPASLKCVAKNNRENTKFNFTLQRVVGDGRVAEVRDNSNFYVMTKTGFILNSKSERESVEFATHYYKNKTHSSSFETTFYFPKEDQIINVALSHVSQASHEYVGSYGVGGVVCSDCEVRCKTKEAAIYEVDPRSSLSW